MGVACFLATGKVVNPSTTMTALTVNSGDSLTIPSFNKAAPAYLENAWVQQATLGVLRIRSPKFHDYVQGIRLTVPESVPTPLLPLRGGQPIITLDTLTVELTGGAAETDVAALQFYINDLDGSAQSLATWDQIAPRIKDITTIEVDLTGQATLGTWSVGTAINGTYDLLHADAQYAVLGYEVSSACCAIAIAGPDTSQLKIGGPGATRPSDTRDWFVNQSVLSGRPHIPVIKAPNKGATTVYSLSNASTAINVGLIVAELSNA